MLITLIAGTATPIIETNLDTTFPNELPNAVPLIAEQIELTPLQIALPTPLKNFQYYPIYS